MHPLYLTYQRSLFFSTFLSLFISHALLGPLTSSGLVFSGDQTQSVAKWGGTKQDVGKPRGAALGLAVRCSEGTGEISRSVSLCVGLSCETGSTPTQMYTCLSKWPFGAEGHRRGRKVGGVLGFPEIPTLGAARAGRGFQRLLSLPLSSPHLQHPLSKWSWQALLGLAKRVPLPHCQIHLGASRCQDDSRNIGNLVISQLENVVKINVFWRLKGCQIHTEPNWVLKMCSSC